MIINITCAVVGHIAQYIASDATTNENGAIKPSIFARNGLCIFGAIFLNEITVVGPVKYATSVAVEITLANTAQSLNNETMIILTIALNTIATRGILYFRS